MHTIAAVCSYFGADQADKGHHFLRVLLNDIAYLPAPTAELAAALVSVQHAVPIALVEWLLCELGKKADLDCISPAAQAAMQIGLVSNFVHLGCQFQAAEREYALIRALEKERNFHEAVAFLRLLSERLEKFLAIR